MTSTKAPGFGTYLVYVGLPLLGLAALLAYGRNTRAPLAMARPWTSPPAASAVAQVGPHLNVAATVMLEMAIILAASALLAFLVRSFYQPHVVGEMIAGILLGPSFFGLIAPDLFAQLFPPATAVHLSVLSQFGLIIYMLLVGASVDTHEVGNQRHAALL